MPTDTGYLNVLLCKVFGGRWETPACQCVETYLKITPKLMARREREKGCGKVGGEGLLNMHASDKLIRNLYFGRIPKLSCNSVF